MPFSVDSTFDFKVNICHIAMGKAIILQILAMLLMVCHIFIAPFSSRNTWAYHHIMP